MKARFVTIDEWILFISHTNPKALQDLMGTYQVYDEEQLHLAMRNDERRNVHGLEPSLPEFSSSSAPASPTGILIKPNLVMEGPISPLILLRKFCYYPMEAVLIWKERVWKFKFLETDRMLILIHYPMMESLNFVSKNLLHITGDVRMESGKKSILTDSIGQQSPPKSGMLSHAKSSH